MMLNEEKRSRLVDVISRPHATLDGAGGSAPAIPLPAAQDSPNPPATDKNKGVLAIDSDDKGTREGIIFKRQRLVVAVTSYSATDGRPPSFRDHPPSASSPRALLALEGGGESAPGGDQVPPAPELLTILQHGLRSFQEKEAAEALGVDLLMECMGKSLGEFFSIPLPSRAKRRQGCRRNSSAKLKSWPTAKRP